MNGDGFTSMAIDLLTMADRPIGDDWGPWKLDAATLALRCEHYDVDLERCLTSAQTLDWIMQVDGKGWATSDVTGGLVRALRDVLDPQQWLCSHEADLTLDHDRLRDLVAKADARTIAEARISGAT